MIAAIGLFRAHATSIDRLVQTTVGRSEMLEDLLEHLIKDAGKKSVQHFLFIGPRGIGKTHFLSLVENAVETRKALNGFYSVIRFPEENNRILGFADILLEIISNLDEIDPTGNWGETHSRLSNLDDDQDIIDIALPRLRLYRKKSGKMLLLLMENLNTLFGEQMKHKQDIHRLRTFLMDSPCATLIGTSPITFPGVTDVREPFFEFFDIQVIEDLSENQTLDLVKTNLEIDQRKDLLDDFDALIPKIKALHTMTGGNPRLAIMLYELIAYDNILEVKNQFQKLLDQVTPFYQDRMRDLAPQERALLETMALMRTEPRTPAAIAARMRKSPQQTSSLLKRMIGSGYLTVTRNPQDKRSRLYRIKEGFFDLWLAMSGSRATRKRLGYLVKLFEVWYQDPTERNKKRSELRQAIEKKQHRSHSDENQYTYLDYLTEIGDCDERCEAKLELAFDLLTANKASKAKRLLLEIKPLAPKAEIFTWMTRQVNHWAENESPLDVSKWFKGLIEYWKIQRSGDLENAVAIAQRLGMDLSGQGLHKIRIKLLQDALVFADTPNDQIQMHNQIAQSQKMDGQLDNALEYLKQSLAISQAIGDKAGEGATLNNISQIYQSRGDYDTALDYLKQSLAITQAIGDKAGEGATLNNISQVYKARGDYDTALEYLKQSLAISQEIGDKAGEGTTLNNISQVYQSRGDYDTALDYLNQALAITQEIGDKAGEGTTLNNISQVYKARGDYDTALDYLKQSLAISLEIGDKAGEGTTLNNISTTYHAIGDYDTALDYLKQSLAIRQEIGDKAGEGTTLNNISQIYQSRGDYDTTLDYLKQSLAITQEIGDKAGEGTTLNNISTIYLSRGDHDAALEYLKQSLAITQEIGDSSGLCVTLFNIGHIHYAKEDIPKAVQAWVTVYRLANSINLAQALDALENLSEQLELPGGLGGWETLAKKIKGDDP